MKNVRKTAVFLCTAALLSIRVSAAQEINFIAPESGVVSFIKAGRTAEDFVISQTLPEASDCAVVTKRGTLGILGGSGLQSVTLSSAEGDVTVRVHDTIRSDFDHVTSPHMHAPLGEKTGNLYAAATAEDNLTADLSDYSIEAGVLNVEFDMLLEEARKTNLITACDFNDVAFAEVQLRFRRDDAVYIAYQRDRYNYTPLRDKLLPTGAWVHIKASFCLDNNSMSLTCDGKAVFNDAPFVGAPAALKTIKIGTGADNIAIYSGTKPQNAELRITSDKISIDTKEDVMICVPLQAQIKLFDTFEELAPEYLSWDVEPNSVALVSQRGMLTVDSALLKEDTVVHAAGSIVLGNNKLKAQKEITLHPDTTGGTAVAGACAGSAGISKASGICSGDALTVSVPIYNAASDPHTYYLVTALYDASGRNTQNYVFRITASAESGRLLYERNMIVTAGNNLNAKVFLLDENFAINVLKK